ncbi:MAG: pseudouridine synthase [Candidatus Marinimicrobia bacterium]|nr:pseudouridine synthase [Candidatus Neomarinimicrobiota bacterium]
MNWMILPNPISLVLDPMRLNKFLAEAGIASRRKSDKLIQMATTEVNGKICLDPAYHVQVDDVVKYDGQKIKPVKEKVVVMLHKPKKVITTVRDTHGRKTVMDLVSLKHRLTPVGRLDQDTTGLLLLTNDGQLHQYLTHPKNQIAKDYEAVIKGRMTNSQIRKLSTGIYIGDKEFGNAEILHQETDKGRSTITLRLRQGKKREIRRIMYYLKLKLLSLKRIRFGGLSLGNLPESGQRNLTKEEIKSLQE